MSSGLLQEYEVMLNVGLGAEALSAFSVAFEAVSNRPEETITLWHIATVLPLVFHEVSRRAISKRQTRSGLRSILARDPNNNIAQNEPIFNINGRINAMYPRTLRSLNCALAWGLLRVEEGRIFPPITQAKHSFSGEARDIIEAAKKLGTWAAQLTAFEYFTILGVHLTG
jgi:hypothetical protein